MNNNRSLFFPTWIELFPATCQPHSVCASLGAPSLCSTLNFPTTAHNHKSSPLSATAHLYQESFPLYFLHPVFPHSTLNSRPSTLTSPRNLHSVSENITCCALKIISPCCLLPAGLPKQKNESSNCLRWWGVDGNTSVCTQFKPSDPYNLFPDTHTELCPLPRFCLSTWLE